MELKVDFGKSSNLLIARSIKLIALCFRRHFKNSYYLVISIKNQYFLHVRKKRKNLKFAFYLIFVVILDSIYLNFTCLF